MRPHSTRAKDAVMCRPFVSGLMCVGLTLALSDTTCADEPTAKSPVTAVAFSPDSMSLLIGSQDGLLQVTHDLKQIRKVATALQNIHGIEFSPDRSVIAVCGGAPAQVGGVELWTWPNLKLRFRSLPHADVVYDVGWQPDGRQVFSAGLDRTTRIVDARHGKSSGLYRGHSRGITAVEVLANHVLVTASIDQSLRVWDTSTGQESRTLNNHTDMIHAIAARPVTDDAPPIVASVSSDKSVRFWQPTIGRMVRFRRMPSIPRAIVWSPDGRHVFVTSQDGSLARIDHETAEVTWTSRALNGWCYSLAVDAQGKRIAVGGQDGQLKLIRID